LASISQILISASEKKVLNKNISNCPDYYTQLSDVSQMENPFKRNHSGWKRRLQNDNFVTCQRKEDRYMGNMFTGNRRAKRFKNNCMVLSYRKTDMADPYKVCNFQRRARRCKIDWDGITNDPNLCPPKVEEE
jgi:hypothetical protein